MKPVGIADLKARLSQHLRSVKEGEIVVVLDRRTPIARIVPHGSPDERMRVRKPAFGAPKPGEVTLPEPVELEVDVVEILLEDRGRAQ